MAFIAQDWKQIINLFHGFADVVTADKGAHFQIFFNTHRGKDILRLRHKSHALDHTLLGGQVRDIFAVQSHGSFAQVQHAENGLHPCGLSRPIGANDHGDLTWVNRNRA